MDKICNFDFSPQEEEEKDQELHESKSTCLNQRTLSTFDLTRIRILTSFYPQTPSQTESRNWSQIWQLVEKTKITFDGNHGDTATVYGLLFLWYSATFKTYLKHKSSLEQQSFRKYAGCWSGLAGGRPSWGSSSSASKSPPPGPPSERTSPISGPFRGPCLKLIATCYWSGESA